MDPRAPELQRVIDAAFLACDAANSKDYDQFIDKVTLYLVEFERWKASYEASEKKKLSEATKELIQKLGDVHAEIIRLANQGRDEVQMKLGELRKRAQLLRSYIDTLPKRITITGKREG